MQALPILTSAQTRVQLQGHEHALARAHTHKHTRLHADRHSRRAHTQACTSAQIQMQTHTCAHTCKLIGVHAHTHARVRADRHGAYTHTYHNDPQTHLPPATCAPATHRHTRTRACIHPIIHTRTHVYTLGSEASHTGMQTQHACARACYAHKRTCTRTQTNMHEVHAPSHSPTLTAATASTLLACTHSHPLTICKAQQTCRRTRSHVHAVPPYTLTCMTASITCCRCTRALFNTSKIQIASAQAASTGPAAHPNLHESLCQVLHIRQDAFQTHQGSRSQYRPPSSPSPI